MCIRIDVCDILMCMCNIYCVYITRVIYMYITRIHICKNNE